MFFHMEFFSLLCSVAAGSGGHLGGWGAPLPCTGTSGLQDWSQQPLSWFSTDRAPSLPGALTHLPMACWTHSAMAFFLQLDWAALKAASPCLWPSGSSKTNSLLFSSAHLQSAFKKRTSLCSFCLLNWEKRTTPWTQSPDIYWQHGNDSGKHKSCHHLTVSFGNFITIVHVSHSSISSVSWPWKTSCYWILTKLLMESLEADVAKFINIY